MKTFNQKQIFERMQHLSEEIFNLSNEKIILSQRDKIFIEHIMLLNSLVTSHILYEYQENKEGRL